MLAPWEGDWDPEVKNLVGYVRSLGSPTHKFIWDKERELWSKEKAKERELKLFRKSLPKNNFTP